MATQVRIYTINRGMMDDWLTFFNKNILPNNEKYGLHILGAWVNRPQNEFVWVRTFASEATLTTYNASPERAAAGDAGRFIAKIEVREVENVLKPAPTGAGF